MANKNLKLNPHPIARGGWWYETPKGIEVVAARPALPPGVSEVYCIPWRSIRNALERKDRAAEEGSREP